MLLLRSSAEREGISLRGEYASLEAPASMTGVLDRLTAIWDEATGHYEAPNQSLAIGAIIQPLLDRKVSGHLSNEYRVSRESFSWDAEWHVGDTAATKHWRVVSAPAARASSLSCRNLVELEAQLRAVARRLSELPFRHHLEWVWDGLRLWIVQADRVAPSVGYPPGDAWQPVIGKDIQPGNLKLWRSLNDITVTSDAATWPKVSALARFAEAGLPVPEIWQLSGTEIIAALSRLETSSDLDDDLALLSSGHLVVRTDVRDHGDGLMQAKTEAETDPRAVLLFLQETAQKVVHDGADPKNVTFLAHRFLRARACAWTFAHPESVHVRVDSTWGLSDGLSWLPHDSAWVNVDTNRVYRSVGGKTAFLDIAEDRSWTCREAPTEWIWRSSVTEDQLRTIAAGASRLARNSNTPFVTMWFVGLLDGAEAECLPWFQSPHVPSPPNDVESFVSRRRVEIRTLQELRTFAHSSPYTPAPILKLNPQSDLVRDKEFIREVIQVVQGTDMAVEIVGSPLGHAYYLLQRAGVTVTCVGSLPLPNSEHNKLVRDNIPRLIQSKGEIADTYRATDQELQHLLRAKIVEESLELLRSETGDEFLDELADVEEAINALRIAAGVTRDALRQRLREKRAVRGGFKDGVVLIRTSAGGTPPPAQGRLPGMHDIASRRAGFQVQRLGNRVVVNPVPPARSEPMDFETQISGQLMRVSYTLEGIEISLVGKSNDSEDAPEAMRLF
jgi:predicted house-cleaning noncanonical NTP pyrophosphatase (MazG superfamily)